jgi:DNA mismatch endonuclease (patch repair protein)
MAGIRQKGTKPELIVRATMTVLGHRYRVENRDLAGSPDLANRARRWAIFVHGCFWHRHPGCRLASTPKRNADFWLAKFERNVERDRAVVSSLEEIGFTVVVVWECETRTPEQLATRLHVELSDRLPMRR